MPTNNAIRIGEIEDRLQNLFEQLADEYDEKRSNALDDEVKVLEAEKANLEQIEEDVCPECGSWESDWEGPGDDLGCMNDYHDEEFDSDEVDEHREMMTEKHERLYKD